MATVLLALALMSGAYEMLFFMIAFREYLTWRIGVIWTLLFILCAILDEWSIAYLPHLPLAIFTIIPMVVVTTVMSSRMLYTKWILMMPIAIFLNAFKRLLGGIMGVLTRYLMQSDAPMLLRQAVGLQSNADINLFLAVLLTLPAVILLSMWAHHWLVRVSAADFLQRARVEPSDYLLVLLLFAIYTIVYAFIMEQSVVYQSFMAIISSVTFGIVGIYLINNKNSHLNDDQLLKQMSVYNELLRQRNQELHLFKHDYQNVLLSLAALLKEKDYAELERYFNEEVLPGGQALGANTELDVLRHLESPVVSGMIYAKHHLAAGRGVQLSVSIIETINLPDVSQVRLVRILGNLLDNAIDAAERADKQVALTIEKQAPQAIIFKVQNQIPPKDTVDLNVIKKGRFTTKRGHLGYGLSSIEQLVTSNMRVDYELQEGQFIAILRLQMDANTKGD
ncbi:sensor histidine kinase [Lactiplantibacillus modestisalitolerans]|uniref:Sensor histidine kinase n=1 Tax=Lactiplantibacillus modestisalitolerans TaxID=1457219 RepID=A0ABV5WRE0_9LACO|nr:GHKL domain-containing protein [Lactiplantibacillus modestisalitolerans]